MATGGTATAVVVRMFGPLSLGIGGVTLGPRDLGGAKPKQLLEVLLLSRGRTVATDRIADALWPDRLPRRVDATIQSYVSVLRKRLGGVGRRLIVTEPGGYRVDAALVDVDLDRFDALLQRAGAGEPADRRAALEAATALGDADVLADEPYADWVALEREHYRLRRLQALTELAECCLELRDHRDALAHVQRVLALDPVSERGYRVAMLAHRAVGARDAALRAYERCRDALDATLGVPPTPELAALHAAMLSDDAPDEPDARPPLPGAPTAAPAVAFADAGDTRIAYQTVGDGPVDLVFLPSFVTHLRANWEDPVYAGFLARLAAMARLIMFDNRGTGLSDPAPDFPTVRQRSDDLARVLDAVGSPRAVTFGVCSAGAVAAQFAVDHADRAAGLILHNSYGRMLQGEGYPWGWPPDRYERLLAGFDQAWLGQHEGIVRSNPGLADNPRYRGWFARYYRVAANPWMARRLAERNADLDIRELLGRIAVPCLVTCTTDDVWFSADNSRYLAQQIAGAELAELPGVDHDPWVGDTEPVLRVVGTFIASLADASRRPPDR